ncbi:unnamed protein product [Euphydryas editha]|uniref:Uncharacterized protein n=1 Tax=Euphydryas editha TaxID=104508 RepID=A0AAU9V133_EUPED|nr:unnamed protein product [Euphydryas editha]
MADWFLDRDYANHAYDAYPFPYYQEKEMQPAPAQCLPLQALPYPCPSPTLTVLLSPAQQGMQQPCDYNPTPKGITLVLVLSKAAMTSSIPRLERTLNID